MTKVKEVRVSGGLGFFGILTLILITLKLTNYIFWGWIWVLAPLWMPVALMLLFLLLFVVFASIVTNR